MQKPWALPGIVQKPIDKLYTFIKISMHIYIYNEHAVQKEIVPLLYHFSYDRWAKFYIPNI